MIPQEHFQYYLEKYPTLLHHLVINVIPKLKPLKKHQYNQDPYPGHHQALVALQDHDKHNNYFHP